MSILGTVIVPHPPLIIPTVGRGRAQEVQATIDAYRAAAKQVAAWEPEVLIITSPIRPCMPTTSTSHRARASPKICPLLVRPRPTCMWSTTPRCETRSSEKKPLRRIHPGSRILSVGSFGCNPCCPFCQNHEISMSGDGELKTIELSPEALADKPPTSVERVYRLADAAREYLAFVYTGNC